MAYNASQQKSPVCHDLRKSDWQWLWGDYLFSFSTLAHRDRFSSEVEKKVEWMADSMSRRFHMPCRFDVLAVFQLYMQIEGRGFHVVNESTGELFESPEECRFDVTLEKVG